MSDYKKRLKKEAVSFNKIAVERLVNGKFPDIRRKFFNPYFYNNIWRSSNFVREHYGDSINWIVTQLKKQGAESVIEFGCGDGCVCLELARAGFKVIGLDVSPESIRIAQDYLKSLPEGKHLNLKYICQSALEYKGTLDSVVCHGFLHHLPPQTLDDFIKKISQDMKPGQILAAVEPRYDKVELKAALLIYTLRLVLPNHFKYSGVKNDVIKDLENIIKETSEADKNQSEMDNESGSEQILNTVKKYFNDVQIECTNAFYDKVIGSLRVNKRDEDELAILLKKLDDIITKYSNELGRTIKFVSKK